MDFYLYSEPRQGTEARWTRKLDSQIAENAIFEAVLAVHGVGKMGRHYYLSTESEWNTPTWGMYAWRGSVYVTRFYEASQRDKCFEIIPSFGNKILPASKAWKTARP